MPGLQRCFRLRRRQHARPGVVADEAARDEGVAEHPRERGHGRRPRHGGRPEAGRPRRDGDHGPRLHRRRARQGRAVLGYPRHRHGQPHRRARPRFGSCRRDHRRGAGRHHLVGAGHAGNQRPDAVRRQHRGRAAPRHRPRDQVRGESPRLRHRPAAGPGHRPGSARLGRQRRRAVGRRLRPGSPCRAGRAGRGRRRQHRRGELPGRVPGRHLGRRLQLGVHQGPVQQPPALRDADRGRGRGHRGQRYAWLRPGQQHRRGQRGGRRHRGPDPGPVPGAEPRAGDQGAHAEHRLPALRRPAGRVRRRDRGRRRGPHGGCAHGRGRAWLVGRTPPRA